MDSPARNPQSAIRNPQSLLMGLALSLLLVILLVALFLRDIRIARAPFILVLRTLMILLTSLVLLGFVFRRVQKERPKLDLLVLADQSQSMSLEERGRQEVDALQALPHKPGWRVGYYGFGDTVQKIAGPGQLKDDGRRTDIVQALKFAQAEAPGAAVLVSDGANNAAGDPTQIARKLPFPVFTVGVGRKAVRDLAVERVRVPQRVALGDTVPVAVRLRSRGFGADRAKVRLYDGGRLIDTKEAALGGEETQQEVEFRTVPAPEGRHLYRVVADSMTGEDNYANNQAQAAILVVPSRTRVLYIANRPGHSTRLLLDLIRENPDFELIPAVSLVGNQLQRITAEGMTPFTLDGTIDADVVILDNVDENALGASDALSAFASRQGLLVLAGEGFQAGRALSPILPLEATGDRIIRNLALGLTEEGRGAAVFFDGTRNLLTDMPPFWAALRSRTVRPDAHVWGKSDDGTPLIAFRRNESGKVLEFAGYPIWRAGFSNGSGSRDDLSRFLTNVIHFLALKDVDRFRLSTDRLDYYSGEPVSVLLQATSDDGRPWSGLDVRLTTNDERKTMNAERLMVDRGNGLYEAELQGVGPGQYATRAEVSAQGKTQGAAENSFTVSELSVELSQSALNEDLLRRIAEASGGAYVPADSVGVRPPQIRFAEYRRTVTFDPRLNRYLFLLIAALFILEIYLRKRRGMM